MAKRAYKKRVEFDFEVLDETIAIVEVGNDYVCVEETRKNGQEDTHMSGVISISSCGAAYWDQGEASFAEYHSQELADAILAYVEKHGIPGRKSA